MTDSVEIAVDDIVEADGPERVGDSLGLSRPRGPHKVHRIQPSMLEGGVAWALLKVPGNPYVTATWPVNKLRKVN